MSPFYQVNLALSDSRYLWSCHFNLRQYALDWQWWENRWYLMVTSCPRIACSYHASAQVLFLGILSGVFFIKSQMKMSGRIWKWTFGLALGATNFSSCGKNYHHLQDVYNFLAFHLLLCVALFRAVEGNLNYAACILNFCGQILFTSVFWLLHIKLL